MGGCKRADRQVFGDLALHEVYFRLCGEEAVVRLGELTRELLQLGTAIGLRLDSFVVGSESGARGLSKKKSQPGLHKAPLTF